MFSLVSRFITLILIVFFCYSCSKPASPNPVPPVTPDTVATVKGTLFYIMDASICRSDLNTGTILWSKPVADLFNGAAAELNYDSSGLLYHRNHTGLTCYNATDGSIVWQFGWAAFNDAAYYGAVALNDSLISFSSPTSAYAPASLYCLNKKTGLLKWQTQIDKGTWTYSHFYSIPVITGDKVITLARDNNGNRKLACYGITNGNLRWETPVDNELVATLKMYQGNIYCVGTSASAYNPGTGALLWKTALDFSIPPGNYFGYPSFNDQGKLLTAGKTASVSNVIKVLDYNSGSILNTYNSNTLFTGYNYSSNTLYASGFASDTSELNAFDLNGMVLKWKYRPYYSVYNPVVTDKYIVTIMGDTNNLLHIAALNLNGVQVRKYNIPGTYVSNNLIFLDENKKVYKQLAY